MDAARAELNADNLLKRPYPPQAAPPEAIPLNDEQSWPIRPLPDRAAIEARTLSGTRQSRTARVQRTIAITAAYVPVSGSMAVTRDVRT